MGEADRGYSREPGREQRTCQSEKWGRSLRGMEGGAVARTKPVKVFLALEQLWLKQLGQSGLTGMRSDNNNIMSEKIGSGINDIKCNQ